MQCTEISMPNLVSDSCLRNRCIATLGHQVDWVNQIFTSMEHYDGILVCSTILMPQLDQAALSQYSLLRWIFVTRLV